MTDCSGDAIRVEWKVNGLEIFVSGPNGADSTFFVDGPTEAIEAFLEGDDSAASVLTAHGFGHHIEGLPPFGDLLQKLSRFNVEQPLTGTRIFVPIEGLSTPFLFGASQGSFCDGESVENQPDVGIVEVLGGMTTLLNILAGYQDIGHAVIDGDLRADLLGLSQLDWLIGQDAFEVAVLPYRPLLRSLAILCGSRCRKRSA